MQLHLSGWHSLSARISENILHFGIGRIYFLKSPMLSTHSSFPLLRTVEEEMVSELVCHFFRDFTLASISVLMVG